MDSNNSGKRCDYTLENYLEKEKKLHNLKNDYESMEQQVGENWQDIRVLNEKNNSFIDAIATKSNMLDFYEKELKNLISNTQETCWRLTKAETVLKSEKEYLSKYEHLFKQENKSSEPDIDFQIIELNISIANLKEKKDDLEKNVSNNDDTINRLLKELNHIENECDILQETIYKSNTV
ncbi:hypothetical protein CBL_08154 [Carabus blaptoides fortunei]